MLTNNIIQLTEESKKQQCLQRKRDIEDKFGLIISAQHNACEYDELLTMLNDIYDAFPKGLIKEITSYYNSLGIKTYVKFLAKQAKVSGSFYYSDKGITLYYYPQSTDKFGEWVIGHEMGHYVHRYLSDNYGSDRLKKEWTSLNKTLNYGIKEWSDVHKDYFVREYSLTNYAEDFATVVELLAEKSNDGYKDKIICLDCPLKQKVNLLLKVLLQCSNSFSKLKKSKAKEYLQLRMAME